jgi:hypothetical protein
MSFPFYLKFLHQLNFIFLLNIIRVLIVKLRQSHTSEVEQARKAVKAAFVLLPLLGITNMLSMTNAPLGSVSEFAVWSYVTHSLTSFQGFFIAMIYCFLNGEVCPLIEMNDYCDIFKSIFDRFEPQFTSQLVFICHSEVTMTGPIDASHLFQPIIQQQRIQSNRCRQNKPFLIITLISTGSN